MKINETEELFQDLKKNSLRIGITEFQGLINLPLLKL